MEGDDDDDDDKEEEEGPLPSFLPGIDRERERERLYEKEYEKGGEGLFFFPSVRFPSVV